MPSPIASALLPLRAASSSVSVPTATADLSSRPRADRPSAPKPSIRNSLIAIWAMTFTGSKSVADSCARLTGLATPSSTLPDEMFEAMVTRPTKSGTFNALPAIASNADDFNASIMMPSDGP